MRDPRTDVDTVSMQVRIVGCGFVIPSAKLITPKESVEACGNTALSRSTSHTFTNVSVKVANLGRRRHSAEIHSGEVQFRDEYRRPKTRTTQQLLHCGPQSRVLRKESRVDRSTAFPAIARSTSE